jgi:hypothetical protein
MAVTYTTFVTSLTTAPALDGLTDVVTAVNWQVLATDGTYYAQQSGSDPVGPPDPTDFTAYPDLTEATVLGWIPDPSTPEVQTYLAANINGQANPTSVVLPPPWNG